MNRHYFLVAPVAAAVPLGFVQPEFATFVVCVVAALVFADHAIQLVARTSKSLRVSVTTRLGGAVLELSDDARPPTVHPPKRE